mgnify:CR=1 FL=1
MRQMLFNNCSAGPYGNVVIHFNQVNPTNHKNPKNDMFFFAIGYLDAANILAEDLLEKEESHRDNEGYPILFLYRHALELFLKWLVFKMELITEWQKMKKITDLINCKHELDSLMKEVLRLIQNTSCDYDKELGCFVKKLETLVKEFNDLDPGSFFFRYSINKQGGALSEESVCIRIGDVRDAFKDFKLNIEALNCFLQEKLDDEVFIRVIENHLQNS